MLLHNMWVKVHTEPKEEMVTVTISRGFGGAAVGKGRGENVVTCSDCLGYQKV